jgi:putative ATPase
MKDEGYGKGYVYAHDTEDKIADMQCLPDNLVGKEYYHPTTQGLEAKYKERYESIKEWRRKQKARKK